MDVRSDIWTFVGYFLCLKVPNNQLRNKGPGHIGQSVGHLTRKSDVVGSIPGLTTYFRFSFC